MNDCCQHIYVIQDLEQQIKVLKKQLETLQAEVQPKDEAHEEVKAKRPYKRRNSGSDSE